MKRFVLLLLFVITCMQSFAYTSQGNWRWRNNNGSETTATWRADQNQSIRINSIDNIIRLRIQVNNNTGNTKGINSNLQYASAPDGPWRYITNFEGNNAFRFSNTNAKVTDQSPTTQQLSGSSNTFIQGKLFVKTNELDVSMTDATTTEFEYSLQPTDNIEPNTTYYFRIPGNDYPVALPALKTTATVKTQPKLLTNGSFEEHAKDWTFKVLSPAAATTSLADSIHKDGIHSLIVNVTQTGTATAVRLTHKAIPLNVGHTYMVRFWAYATKNSAKLQLALKGKKTLPYSFKLYTGWQEYTFAFKAADSKAALHFLFQTATSYVIDKVEILDENNEEVDVSMNYMWQNNRPESEYSWLSADGENSEQLPDGRTVWTFSDGWYGYNDTTTNSMSTHQLLRNTFVTQSKPRPNGALHTIIGGTLDQPQALMIPPDKRGHDNFFWPRDMTVENDSLKVLLPEVIQWHENDPLTDGHRQAVGVFSLPDLKLQSIKWMPWLDSVTTNYIALCKGDDGYTYAYGSRQITSTENHAVVARFPTGQLSATTPWQFLTNDGWSNDPANSKEIADVQLYSVARLGYHNYMSLFLNPLSDKIEVLYAESPVGPWVGRSIVGQIEGQQDILSYFGLLHEETANNGVYTFSYSNIGNIGQMLDDKTVYWPSYLKADLKSLSPFNNNVAPVDKLEFTANHKGKRALLQWKWETVVNTNRFEIERSADGRKDWTTIAVVSAKDRASAANYELFDNKPFDGKNYYRLKRVDITGNSALSPVKLVTVQSAAVATIFPNPTHGAVNVIINSKVKDNITAVLTDMKGTVVHQEIIPVTAHSSQYVLHINQNLAHGLYSLQLKGKELDIQLKVAIQ
ncbi:T9SS type A sorting domain-containing protein [Ilyomonas limi]|uniref:T9SS type A sorting domain-containing protein n=1 Tax=Ilyomonas limi TaxID=2575867 RepID=A0A4U3KZ54_9BACT|nr:carbohydrate binding domain-containing protein [Ilyomonas limi]TKK67945.1 T9SS type A sorting domain-containing protein [Ilyomonas limi]